MSTVLSRGHETKVRAVRVGQGIGLKVIGRSIGSNLSYNLTTENVSRSGMLLRWDSPVKIPFSVNSILEVAIQPDAESLQAPVTCLLKVVRRDNGDRQRALFGCQVAQMDPDYLVHWNSFVGKLEHQSDGASCA